MHLLKPTLFGAFGGLAAALAILLGLYLSPMRLDLYFSADPELADVRAKLSTYQEWLAQADARIAAQDESAPIGDSDSLRTEQARAWREYKAWRTRMGDLARLHDHPGGMLFPRWAFSLRYWAGPGAAALILLPALFGAWRTRGRYRPSRTRPGKAPRGPRKDAPAPGNAMSRFEDAVKQVARISESRSEPAPPRPAPPVAKPAAPEIPPTDAIPVERYTEAAPPPSRKEPETVPLPLAPDPGPEKQDGRETKFFQVGPGWGHPPGDPRIAKPDLPMEDEDTAGEGNADETLGVMPPTTEVERVERRKEEVLKLARKGLTSSEISRRLRISQDQVEFIIRLRREKG